MGDETASAARRILRRSGRQSGAPKNFIVIDATRRYLQAPGSYLSDSRTMLSMTCWHSHRHSRAAHMAAAKSACAMSLSEVSAESSSPAARAARSAMDVQEIELEVSRSASSYSQHERPRALTGPPCAAN